MLVEFRVRNYKSIRDEQTLSMVASGDKTHQGTHVIKDAEEGLDILKSAVIYGANASGKSNLIDAIAFMRTTVMNSEQTELKHLYPVPVFKLSGENKDNSEFEAIFIIEDTRYQYGFTIHKDRFFIEEWLLAYKSDKPQEWFHRKYDFSAKEYTYKFSSYFKGQKKLWQKSTRNDSLFLSVAVQLNSEQLKPLYSWFMKLIVQTPSGRISNMISLRYLENEEQRRAILAMMISADVGISDIRLEEIDFSHKSYQNHPSYPFLRDDKGSKVKMPFFIHTDDRGLDIDFALNEESDGTRRLFMLAPFILNVLKNGRVLVVDELESSLHPKIIRFIVGLFNSAENNPKGAQLIFSTHYSGLLDKEVFRRDQIWFVEKNKSQATELYPLSDYRPRSGEALEKGYLIGRYGAIPFLSEFKLFVPGDGGGNGA